MRPESNNAFLLERNMIVIMTVDQNYDGGRSREVRHLGFAMQIYLSEYVQKNHEHVVSRQEAEKSFGKVVFQKYFNT